jgi:hypothetical protein
VFFFHQGYGGHILTCFHAKLTGLYHSEADEIEIFVFRTVVLFTMPYLSNG